MSVKESHKVVLCIGSNMPQGASVIADCAKELDGIIDSLICTAPYSTPPEGIPASERMRPYLNMVAEGLWSGSIDILNVLLKDIELRAGRDAESRGRGEVILDIDIVVADGNVLRVRDFESSFFQEGYRRLSSVEANAFG